LGGCTRLRGGAADENIGADAREGRTGGFTKSISRRDQGNIKRHAERNAGERAERAPKAVA
jgi:hypothetical protein